MYRDIRTFRCPNRQCRKKNKAVPGAGSRQCYRCKTWACITEEGYVRETGPMIGCEYEPPPAPAPEKKRSGGILSNLGLITHMLINEVENAEEAKRNPPKLPNPNGFDLSA